MSPDLDELRMTQEAERARNATHRCKVCNALWIKWPDGTWSLASQECGQCCDNAPMGDQIEEFKVAPAQPTEADFQWAAEEIAKLQSDLDISNADHIVLWLEENAKDHGDGLPHAWLACRIIEAHEAAIASAYLTAERVERERCARIALSFENKDWESYDPRTIATAIRSVSHEDGENKK